jgi:hypothetical protein
LVPEHSTYATVSSILEYPDFSNGRRHFQFSAPPELAIRFSPTRSLSKSGFLVDQRTIRPAHNLIPPVLFCPHHHGLSSLLSSILLLQEDETMEHNPEKANGGTSTPPDSSTTIITAAPQFRLWKFGVRGRFIGLATCVGTLLHSD